MQKLVLDIEESRYTLLLQFLRTLDYVKIVQVAPNHAVTNASKTPDTADSQLELLKTVLSQQSKLPYQDISDPSSWQKQQRDEWS